MTPLFSSMNEHEQHQPSVIYSVHLCFSQPQWVLSFPVALPSVVGAMAGFNLKNEETAVDTNTDFSITPTLKAEDEINDKDPKKDPEQCCFLWSNHQRG